MPAPLANVSHTALAIGRPPSPHSLSVTGGAHRYVHADDVRDDSLQVDLDVTFKKQSMKKGIGASTDGGSGSMGGAMSVLGAVGAPPSQQASIFVAADGGGNPFDSRMFGQPVQPVRGARLIGSDKPKLHQSRSMIRD